MKSNEKILLNDQILGNGYYEPYEILRHLSLAPYISANIVLNKIIKLNPPILPIS